VTKQRDKGISIVHFYTEDDGKSLALKTDYEKFASDHKGVFRIGAVDCGDFTEICAKEKINSYPLLRVYPTFPAPI